MVKLSHGGVYHGYKNVLIMTVNDRGNFTCHKKIVKGLNTEVRFTAHMVVIDNEDKLIILKKELILGNSRKSLLR